MARRNMKRVAPLLFRMWTYTVVAGVQKWVFRSLCYETVRK
jgi:hypothetical protein